MSLNHIYAPVQEDLAKVEEKLEALSKVDFAPLAKLLEHSLGDGGKRIRPALVLLAGKLYRYNLDSLLLMATAVELLHTATLIHDDAVDSADTRRGKPTINSLWDIDKAVLLGDHLFAWAEEFAATTGNLRVIRLSARTLQVLSGGEINQSFNAFNPDQTREQYLKRIAAKTAALLATCTECGAILSEAPEASIQALRAYGYDAGIAFQIVDDILDFTASEEELGKPVGSDLVQGTLTLPALCILERYPGDNPVKEVFRKRGKDAGQAIAEAIEIVRSASIVDECYQLAASYADRACASLGALPDKPARQALRDLSDYIVKRRR
ncbi:MAG: polyprenyl synthetase family protein [Chloroflexi bacterium]|nr:polyprenyl synthetase family protein [Chloroflexota bacterium]